jgi:ankyrin repeat protein
MVNPITIVHGRYLQGMFLLALLTISGCGPSTARQAEIAIETGDTATLRRLLDEGLDPNHFFPGRNDGYRLVHVAARYANLEAMKLLVSRHADINVRDDFRGETPLMWTINFRNSFGIADDRYLDVFKYLLSRGADLELRSREKRDIAVYVNELTSENPEYKKALQSAQESLKSEATDVDSSH